MTKPCKIVKSSREIIEKKLLVSITDPGTVACILSKHDLNTLIVALNLFPSEYRSERHKSLLQDLKQLRREAFSKEL